MNDIALEAGKKFLRPETGFIHYFYQGPPAENLVAIPVYENLNWALTHFQVRTQDSVLEGKRILERVLAFQNADGEFPLYLHEYPNANDHFLGASLFYPLWIIQKDFAGVIGSEMREKLKNALLALIGALKKRMHEKNPQGFIGLKTLAVLHAYEGTPFTGNIPALGPLSSRQLAELELIRQLGIQELPHTPHAYWHPEMQTYCGPAYKEMHQGYEPEVGLFDIMMKTTRKKVASAQNLAAALVHTSPELVDEFTRGLRQEKNWSYSAVEKNSEAPLYFHPGFHLFRFLTGDNKKIESIALQGSRLNPVRFMEFDKGIEFSLGLGEDFDPENREKNRELELYITRGAKLSCSTFYLNEPVELLFAKVKVTLTFSLLEGTGDFIGQLSHGNRPSQLLKAEAYDQILSLRTLRRSSTAVIGMKVVIEALPDV